MKCRPIAAVQGWSVCLSCLSHAENCITTDDLYFQTGQRQVAVSALYTMITARLKQLLATRHL